MPSVCKSHRRFSSSWVRYLSRCCESHPAKFTAANQRGRQYKCFMSLLEIRENYMSNCSCASANAGFQQIDETSFQSLKSFSEQSASKDATTQKAWLLGSQMCPVQGTADGKQGCVTVPFAGIPVKLCWEILELDLIPPSVGVKVKVTVSVAGTQYLSAILLIKCESITNPSSCTITIENDLFTIEALRPSCNWGCLKRCAPPCVTCGTDYWCWAACAASCVIRCCSLW